MNFDVKVCITFCIVCCIFYIFPEAENEVVIMASKEKIDELDQFLKDYSFAHNAHIDHVRDFVPIGDIDEYIRLRAGEYAANHVIASTIKGIKFRTKSVIFDWVIEDQRKISITMLASRKRYFWYEIILAEAQVNFEPISQGFWSWLAGEDEYKVKQLANKFNDDVLKRFLLTKLAEKAGLCTRHEDSQ